MLKITPVYNMGTERAKGKSELVEGDFNEILIGLADETLKTNEFNFFVVSKTEN